MSLATYRPLRVAIITTVHSPFDVRIFHKQAVSLASVGYEVSLLSRQDTATDRLMVTDVLSKKHVRDRPLVGGSSRTSRPRLWCLVWRELRVSDFDVWHFHDPELLPLLLLARLVLRKSRTSLVYDVHEDYPLEVLEKEWIPPGLRRSVSILTDRVERWGLSRCDLVVAATDAIGHRVRKDANRSVVVHNYPIDLPPPTRRRTGSPVRVVFVGGLAPNRGIHSLVEAMALVQCRQLQLHLYGTFGDSWGMETQAGLSPFEAEIRAIAGANVILHGEVEFGEIASILANADIGVVPFLPTRNHIQALPNKIFEYMRAGLPIVASDFDLWRRMISGVGCGLVVDPSEPSEIAAAFDTLAADPNLRDKMGQRALACVKEEFSWKFAERELLASYADLAVIHESSRCSIFLGPVSTRH